MSSIAREIMADLEKLAGMMDDQQARDTLETVLHPMPSLVEAEEKASRQLGIYFKERRRANQRIVEHLKQRTEALKATLAEIREKFTHASEGMPKSPPAPTLTRPPIRPKAIAKPPVLLPGQELRDQIARKIERPPAPPQTTGNIWENWSKNPQPPAPTTDEENHP